MDGSVPDNLTKKERRELKRQEKLARRGAAARSQKTKRIGIWIGALSILALIVAGLVRLGGGATPATSPGGAPAPVTSADWIFGNPAAAVTLIEYSDFECPACAVAEPAVTEVRRQFADQLRFVYRHFPLAQHPMGKPASYAAEAAGRQGKFWEMHDLLFSRQRDWAGDRDAEDKFRIYAKELGLDETKFAADFSSSETRDAVAAYITEGFRAGVDSTPTFYLNGRKLQLRSFNDLRAEVQAALALVATTTP